MEPIDIGIAVSAGLLVLVVLGMRVAFAAAIAGLVGLLWIFWAKRDYDSAQFLWALTVATKTAGQVPHSKVASQALSLIPTFILIGYLAYYAGLTRALFEAAKRWVGWLPGGLAVSPVFATAGFAAAQAGLANGLPPVHEFRRGGMVYRQLGRSDLYVSLLSFGSHTDPA